MRDRLRKHAVSGLSLAVLISVPWVWVVLRTDISIQWDAASYFFPHQHHFSEAVRAGKLPVWTSGLFSGFPFLADMQVGAWYPLNWPFFLAGIKPGSLFLELWLHALLAGVGTYLLVWTLFRSAGAAVFAALTYALSGFFSAHVQHVCLFQTAAWLPLVLWLVIQGIEQGSNRALALATLASGTACLAGHFQTALYLTSAVVLVGVSCWWSVRGKNWRRVVLALAVIGAGSALVSAVQALPSAELLVHSLRSRLVATHFTGGILTVRSVATYLTPNAAGAFNAQYTGPQDLTQHYFFAGSLLVPLALAGLWVEGKRRLLLLLLLVPMLWYSLGPAGGLYSVVVRLPGFASIRGPSHSLFVVTLGLSVAAAAYVSRLRMRWLIPALCLLTTAELVLWNFVRTRMVYSRESYEVVEGRRQRWLGEMARLPLPAGSRLAAPERWEGVGFGPVQFGVETTFGANALMPARYFDYLEASNRNYALLRGLGVSRYFDPREWKVNELPGWLPRFSVPATILTVAGEDAARRSLDTLDPAAATIVEGPGAGIAANGTATVAVREFTESRYTVEVDARSPALVRIAVPWFPGWRASLDGRRAAVERVDHALMGVRVPAGTHRLVLEYRQNYLLSGALVSIVTCLLLLYGALRSRVQQPGGERHRAKPS